MGDAASGWRGGRRGWIRRSRCGTSEGAGSFWLRPGAHDNHRRKDSGRKCAARFFPAEAPTLRQHPEGNVT